MKIHYNIVIGIAWLLTAAPVFGQAGGNCFLEDFEPKYAIVPPYEQKVEIVDLMGRIVYSQAISPSETVLQLQPNLASGSYFVRLHNRREVKVTKLIISK